MAVRANTSSNTFGSCSALIKPCDKPESRLSTCAILACKFSIALRLVMAGSVAMAKVRVAILVSSSCCSLLIFACSASNALVVLSICDCNSNCHNKKTTASKVRKINTRSRITRPSICSMIFCSAAGISFALSQRKPLLFHLLPATFVRLFFPQQRYCADRL